MTARQRDPVHARCSAYIRRRLERCGWIVEQEVRINRGRSHGFIDILASHPSTGTLLVGEIKTELHDVGALQRTVAWYVDEARSISGARHWSASTVIAMVALLESAENDDRARANQEPLRQAFPVRSQRLANIVADPSRLATIVADPSRLEAASTAVPGPGFVVSGLAMIDPTRRRKRWLVPTSADGRRTPPTFRDYRHAALAISPGATHGQDTEPERRSCADLVGLLRVHPHRLRSRRAILAPVSNRELPLCRPVRYEVRRPIPPRAGRPCPPRPPRAQGAPRRRCRPS